MEGETPLTDAIWKQVGDDNSKHWLFLQHAISLELQLAQAKRELDKIQSIFITKDVEEINKRILTLLARNKELKEDKKMLDWIDFNTSKVSKFDFYGDKSIRTAISEAMNKKG